MAHNHGLTGVEYITKENEDENSIIVFLADRLEGVSVNTDEVRVLIWVIQ